MTHPLIIAICTKEAFYTCKLVHKKNSYNKKSIETNINKQKMSRW